jgi:macrolide transport system ATP-binding/permease protein
MTSTSSRPWHWLITFIGVIVPGRLRADWRQEWVAELHHREALLAEWDRLNLSSRLTLMWNSAGAFWDALWMQTYRWEDAMFQDIRYAIRMMRRAPGFTAVSVLALALGIGVNTAILSAVNGFVLRPLPVDRPTELIRAHWGGKNDARVWGDFSFANYLDIRDQNNSFEKLCASRQTSAGVSSRESRQNGDDLRAEVVWGELVTANYFDVMGVKPILGRDFLPEEDRTPNTHPVAVISYELWQDRFQGNTDALGKQLYLNGQLFTVIGVMPKSFLGTTYYLRHSFWTPVQMAQRFGRRPEWNTDRTYGQFHLFGRLKPGTTVDQAQADLNGVVNRLGQVYPTANEGARIELRTELDSRYNEATRYIQYAGILAVAVSILVLLVACANVASLMLARATARAREIGTRLAIGAGRGRIIRQLLTESVVLSLLGGLVGLVFAYVGAMLIQATFPQVPYPMSLDLTLDSYALKWMLVVSLATSVVFGLAPALFATRSDLIAVIKGSGGELSGSRRWNVRGALVVAQVTISIVVLICAGLFMRSLRKALNTDPGFSTDNLVTMMVNPRMLGYDQESTWRFFPEVLRRIESQPGVRRAALGDDLLLTSADLQHGPIVREGESDPPPNQGITVNCSYISPNYFDTVRSQIVLGREFTDRDKSDAPAVVVVNEEFARKFYGDSTSALGRRFRFAQGTPYMEIVGIAKDGFYRSLYDDKMPYMFLPVYQQRHGAVTIMISANSASDLKAVADSARSEIGKIDSRLPVVGVIMARQNLQIAYWGPRLAAAMASTFGVLGLILATMGLYSVMTFAVSQRTKEIGIRMALGATLSDVLRLIIGQGMRMVLIGLALGLVGAFLLTRMLSNFLLGVGTTDPVTFIGVPVLLLVVGLFACWVPARRATRVNPLVALRQE